MTEEELAQRDRSRQHGADIAADQRRGEAGNRFFRAIPYAAGLLLASAVIYFAAGAADSELDHAPRAPEPLAAQPHELPPPQP